MSRHIVFLSAFFSVLSTACLVLIPERASVVPVPEIKDIGVLLQNYANNRLLDVSGGTDHGKPVITWNSNGRPNQKWHVDWTNRESGTYLTPFWQDGGTAKVLDEDVYNRKALVWEMHGRNNQIWQIVKVSGGNNDLYKIVGKGSQRCLQSNGTAQVITNPCNSDSRQHWRPIFL